MGAEVNNAEVHSLDTELYLQYINFTYTTIDAEDEKILLKPGDLIAVLNLHPLPPGESSGAPLRILLIHRFWTIPDENERHIIVINPDAVAPPHNRLTNETITEYVSPSFQGQNARFADVRETVLVEAAGLLEEERQIADMGTLTQLVVRQFN